MLTLPLFIKNFTVITLTSDKQQISSSLPKAYTNWVGFHHVLKLNEQYLTQKEKQNSGRKRTRVHGHYGNHQCVHSSLYIVNVCGVHWPTEVKKQKLKNSPNADLYKKTCLVKVCFAFNLNSVKDYSWNHFTPV